MILSRLTFSLASLVFLIAFGFIMMPTIADEGGGGTTANPHGKDGHSGEQTAVNTFETTHPDHKHPTVSSITVKTGANVSPNGKNVLIKTGTANTTGTGLNQLILVVEFDQDVNADGTSLKGAGEGSTVLSNDDFTVRTRNADNVIVGDTTPGNNINSISADDVVITNAKRVETGTGDDAVTDYSKFEVVVSFGTGLIPKTTNDTDDPPVLSDNSFTFYVRLNTEAAFALKQPGTTGNDSNGGGSYESDFAKFTLVASLGDITRPTVAIAKGTQTGRNLTVTVTADDKDGTNAGTLDTTDALMASEITVTGGTLTSVTGTTSPYTANIQIAYDTTTVNVKVAENAVKDTSGNGNAETEQDITVTSIATPQDGVIASIPAEGYVVLVHDEGNAGLPSNLPAGATVMEWAAMPNLKDLFVKTGGTIALTGSNTATFDHDGDGKDPRKYADRDVIISEVMAGINLAARGTTGEMTHQWIEIHNKLKVPATNIQISYVEGRAAPNTAGKKLLDQLSNQVGQGWKFTGLGQDGSDDGNPATEDIDFKSFYRKEPGKDGKDKGNWATATELYFAGHKGTPGEGEPVAPKTFAKSEVKQTVIFNEVSNSDTAGHEWIELMIKSGDPNFENWQVSMVTAVGTETEIFTLPKLDTARYDKVLLVTASDPANDPDHPLAAGYDVTKDNAANSTVGRDSSIKYITRAFKTELPDDGKFVLILRHGNDKRGTADKVEDIAGWTDANLSKSDATIHTDLWPLINHGKPNITRNSLNKGVHRRQHGILGTTAVENKDEDGKAAFVNIGWTGIGYKRNAANTAANGGTPGYPHGASLSDQADAAKLVIISEVMYSQGSAGKLAQWIELHNPSDTQGVNLNNWDLRIVNHSQDSEGKAFTGDITEKKIRLAGLDIPPNQTALIVSHAGRNTTMLPKQRLKNLRLAKPMLNANGFYISLWAHAHKDTAIQGDVVGNLVAPDPKERSDHQSYTDPVWALPSGMDATGKDRVSAARRIKKDGTALSGAKPGGWVRTEDDTRYNQMTSVTYYGHANDISSPGQTVGSVLPVSLSKFRPERLKATGEIVVRWVTESELNNAGFNILRSEKRDGEFTKLNEQLILGQGTTSERTAYEWKDTTAKPNVVYYYQIQDVSLDGNVQTLRQSRLKGNVTAAGKLTTTWGELKSQD